MNNLILIIFFTLLIIHLTYSQSCKPHPKKASLDQLAALSPIVVEVSPHQSDVLNHVKKGSIVNVSAEVVGVFSTRNGGLSDGSVITFGPVGKVDNCTNLKVDGSAYLLFLQEPDQNGFYWIQYNPVKAVKRSVRKVKKVLCNKCLIPASFKATEKTIKKSQGKKLKIRCKAKGKPRASLSWYYNGVLLTKSNTPNDFKIKNSKKGRSGFLEISSLAQQHDGNTIMCSAINIASKRAANYTVTLKVSKGAVCPHKCPIEYSSYCIHGRCCVQDVGPPHCLCSSQWVGNRCEKRAEPTHGRNYSEDYRHQQRLVAVLGMCLALMVILFLCFSVYCLFKKKRNEMHRKMFSDGFGPTDASPMLQLQDEPDGRTVDDKAFSTAAVNHIEVDSGREKRNLNSFSGQERRFSDHNSDVSSVATALEESCSHPKLMKKVSVTTISSETGNNNKRNRLNGLAKSGPSRSSFKQNGNSTQNNSNSGMLRRKNLAEVSNLSEEETASKSSLSHHEIHVVPSIPLDSGIRNMVKNQTTAPKMSGSRQAAPSELPGHQDKGQYLHLHIPHPTSHDSTNDNKHHTVTTFSPDGDIQQESIGRNEGTLSSVTPHSPISSPENTHCPIHASSSTTGNLSQSSISTNQEPGSIKSLNKNSNSNRVVDIGRDADTRTSDQDDPFRGMEIPDTSLGLYGATPQHSLKKPKLTRQMHAVDADGFYYPSSVPQPYANASIASAQLHRLPRLSGRVSSPVDSDSYDSNVSLSSVSDSESSFDESESPKIVV